MNELQFIIYQLPEEEGKVQVVIKDETIFATQKAMAQLFDCSTDNIGLHLKNIFFSGELEKDSVTEKISATAADGKNYLTTFYSLDAIIAVGYRVSAKVTIGDKEILIRGSKKGAVIPDSIIDKIQKGKGTFDFHSHPYDNDNVPSQDDYDVMASIYHATSQKTSKIVTPNGRITVYSHRGIVEIGTVSNKIDDAHKKALLKLFGGK